MGRNIIGKTCQKKSVVTLDFQFYGFKKANRAPY